MGIPQSDAPAWDADFFAWREAAGDHASVKRKSKRKGVNRRLSDDSDSLTEEEEDDGGSPALGRGRAKETDDECGNSQAVFDEVVKGRTTVVFKVKSPVDVCFTPLAIESLQR